MEATIPATWDAISTVSALLEMEASIPIKLEALSAISALLEMEAVITVTHTTTVSALVEMEATVSTRLEALWNANALVEMEADITAFKHVTQVLSGALIPAGTVSPIPIFIQGVGGIFVPVGSLDVRNPEWLLIDDALIWMGEWDVTRSYGLDEVVLYKTGDGGEWHVFVSKITHNVGNIPVLSAAAWRRLYQEPLI